MFEPPTDEVGSTLCERDVETFGIKRTSDFTTNTFQATAVPRLPGASAAEGELL